MKKSLRFASAALAVALAASCAAPAFAAGGSSFTKSETVYAVMNADGSIQSTTVSEHVYSASGLSKVTDQSTLTNIQNTESSAEFTQDGEKLVWNTDDTDVYYKGDTTRALPIQATVTYALDGQEAALEDLIGKSGHLTMTIALKNNETGTVNVNGTDRTIVTPLVTAVGVIFGQDATNVVAAHGLVESAAKSNVAAFVTLPGVKDSLSGLLPDELDTIEDYLQDTITVEADVTELTCPQVMMACATSAAALGTDNVFDLSSLNDLTDGINQLNDAMSQLLDGASQLEDGTSQLSSGVLALLDGANTLNNGAAALDKGLGQLQQQRPEQRRTAGGRRRAGFCQQDPERGRSDRHRYDLGQLRRSHRQHSDHERQDAGCRPPQDGAYHLGAGSQLQRQPAGSGAVPFRY